MNPKRWTALVIALVLFLVSIGVNGLILSLKSATLANADKIIEEQSTETPTKVMIPGDAKEKIAYLQVDGTIQNVETGAFAVGYNHKHFLAQLDAVKKDATIQGVVLYVNSPGGGVIESAEIRKKLLEMKEARDIPVYVTMGAMAASGGYYISAPADKIFAMQETITGSIGVIMQTINYQELAKKIGVRYENFQSGEHKDMLSPMRQVTPEERAMMQEMINESYETFVDIIEEGRGMKEADVKKVADGRIMSGTQAIKAGLVDEIADRDQVIEAMRQDFDLADAQVVEFTDPSTNWRSLFGLKTAEFFGPSLEERFIMKMLTNHNTPQMMYLYGDN